MAITSGQLYIIASILLLLIVAVIIAYCIWYKRWKKARETNEYKKFHDEDTQKTMIPQRTPKIRLNTVEFTVPQSNLTRTCSWAEGSGDEFKYHVDEKVRRSNQDSSDSEVSSLRGSLKGAAGVSPYMGVKTNVGHLKPELYNLNDDQDYDMNDDLPLGNIGRVWFSLEYDVQSEQLVVVIDRIRNLPSRDKRSSLSLSSNSSCDPFIRLYLLPDEKRYLQSKMKRKTTNPVFNETFMFTMSYSLLVERTLRITVFDVDRFMRQTIIGHIIEPLSELDVTMKNEVWRDIEKSSQLSNNSGRIQIGLTYFPALNRIAVNLIRGQNIHSDEIPNPDCYVKITYSVLNKVQKSKKSTVQKSTSDPFFNQTFEFKTDKQSMDIICINFDVYHSTPAMVKNDKLIGSFIVGGALCTRGKELEHWEGMIIKPQTVVKEWHDLRL